MSATLQHDVLAVQCHGTLCARVLCREDSDAKLIQNASDVKLRSFATKVGHPTSDL